jgi:hypothetical protein
MRSADENRELSARGNFSNQAGRVRDEVACRIILSRSADVDEVMRDSAHFFHRYFFCADVEPAIYLSRIDRDDLAAS